MPLPQIEAHHGWVRSLNVSPDGKLLASGGNDNLVKLWNATDGAPVRELSGHANHVPLVPVHPDGQALVSGDLKGIVKQWDVSTGSSPRELTAPMLAKYDTVFGGYRRHAHRHGLRRGRQMAGRQRHHSRAERVRWHRQRRGGALRLGERPGEAATHREGCCEGSRLGRTIHPDGFVIGATGGGGGGHLLFWKTDAPNEFSSDSSCPLMPAISISTPTASASPSPGKMALSASTP